MERIDRSIEIKALNCCAKAIAGFGLMLGLFSCKAAYVPPSSAEFDDIPGDTSLVTNIEDFVEGWVSISNGLLNVGEETIYIAEGSHTEIITNGTEVITNVYYIVYDDKLANTLTNYVDIGVLTNYVEQSTLTNYVEKTSMTNYVEQSTLTNYVKKSEYKALLNEKADIASLLSLWYPDSLMYFKTTNNWTTNLRYTYNDTDKTASVLPFCKTSTGNDNSTISGVSGMVVIPPFVIRNGETYTVTEIAGGYHNAQQLNHNLLQLIAPTTVTKIGNNALDECVDLTMVALPGVETVDGFAFASAGIESISLPRLYNCDYSAFFNCTNLVEVKFAMLPSTTSYLFNNCVRLSSFEAPNLLDISDDLFVNCTNLHRVAVPKVKSLFIEAFANCASLEAIYLPEVEDIQNGAFRDCVNLQYIDFGENRDYIPSVEVDAFDNVPRSCKFIVPDSLYDNWMQEAGWSNLATLGYRFLKQSEWKSVRQYELDGLIGNMQMKSWYPDGSVTSSDEWTPMWDGTTGLKYNLDDSTLTASVKPFGSYTGFDGNTQITGSVVVPPYVVSNGKTYTVTAIAGAQNYPTEVSTLTSIVAPTTVTNIAGGAFYNCTNLVSVSMEGVTTMGGVVFTYCKSLETVNLPEVKYIANEEQFLECDSLKDLAFPKLLSIANDMCSLDDSLQSIYVPAVTNVGDSAFESCSNLALVDFGNSPRSVVPPLGYLPFYQVPKSCVILVPDAQYDAWIAAPGWSTLYAEGYKFLKHSEGEYTRQYQTNELKDRDFVIISSTDNVDAVDAQAATPIEYVVTSFNHDDGTVNFATANGFRMNLKSYVDTCLARQGVSGRTVTEVKFSDIKVRYWNYTGNFYLAVYEMNGSIPLITSSVVNSPNNNERTVTFPFSTNVWLAADKTYDFKILPSASADTSGIRMRCVNSPFATDFAFSVFSNGSWVSHPDWCFRGGSAFAYKAISSVPLVVQSELAPTLTELGFVNTNNLTELRIGPQTRIDQSQVVADAIVPMTHLYMDWKDVYFGWDNSDGYVLSMRPETNMTSDVDILVPTNSGTIALVSQVYDAVTNIAPAWVSNKSYQGFKMCSYNGIVYQNTNSTAIAGTTTPEKDNRWKAVPVSDLFLPLTGGKVSYLEAINDIDATYGSGYLKVGNTEISTSAELNPGGFVLEDGSELNLPRIGEIDTFAVYSQLFTPYRSGIGYNTFDVRSYDGKIYVCTNAYIAGGGDIAPSPSHWKTSNIDKTFFTKEGAPFEGEFKVSYGDITSPKPYISLNAYENTTQNPQGMTGEATVEIVGSIDAPPGLSIEKMYNEGNIVESLYFDSIYSVNLYDGWNGITQTICWPYTNSIVNVDEDVITIANDRDIQKYYATKDYVSTTISNTVPSWAMNENELVFTGRLVVTNNYGTDKTEMLKIDNRMVVLENAYISTVCCVSGREIWFDNVGQNGNFIMTVQVEPDPMHIGDETITIPLKTGTLALQEELPSITNTYDFATEEGLYTAVRDIIQVLGGSVTNFPAFNH